MPSEFTPTDERMSEWIGMVDNLCGHAGESIERYDRWLAQHDAEVARKTLEDAADAFHGSFYNVPKGEVPFTKMSASHPYTGHFLQTHDQQMLMRYLRDRAASISTDKADR